MAKYGHDICLRVYDMSIDIDVDMAYFSFNNAVFS